MTPTASSAKSPPGSNNETPPALASNGCSQPKKPAPKWAAPTPSRPKSHNHCAEVLGRTLPECAALPVAPRRNGVGKQIQCRHRRLPVDAAIGNALAVSRRRPRHHVLAARDQIALDHDAHDALLATGYLAADIGHHQRLVLGLLAAVGVTGIDHDPRGY